MNAFVTDYVREVFVGRQYAKMAAKVESVTKCSDAWRTPITPELAVELGLPRPLLQVI